MWGVTEYRLPETHQEAYAERLPCTMYCASCSGGYKRGEMHLYYQAYQVKKKTHEIENTQLYMFPQ